MIDNRRCRVLKVRLTESEYKRFQENLTKSGARNSSEYLREKIFLSDYQITNRERIASKIGQEQLEAQLNILSNMYGIINQYKASVDVELAVDELEGEIKKLCQLLK